jgi:F-actin capping protein, beta subunit
VAIKTTNVFAGVILIKKAGDGSKKIKGCWDSIHVFEVQEKPGGRSAHYKLTSTAMLWLQTNKQGSGTMNLGGSLTRQVISIFPLSLCNGRTVLLAIILLKPRGSDSDKALRGAER